ncbi:MAG: O-antigen ligase family protein [Patescibacteria group bacterium]|nr:O-antigen ligase family protein [Patescibacteria group bacterium]
MFLKISRYCLYASLFSVLIVLPTTFFPFIGGKDYFFRVAIELALISFVLWWAFEAKEGEAKKLFHDVLKSPIFWGVTAFAFVFLLASLFAYDPHAAFWSNYERGEGGFQMIHYYLFFVMLAVLFRSWEDWKRAMQVFLIVAGLSIGYGILANAQVSGFLGDQSHWAGRFMASLGNADYVGVYMIFAMFFTFYLFITSKEKLNWEKMIPYAALIIFYLIFFVLAGTRGAVVGLAFGAIALLIYLIIKNNKLRRPLSIFLIAMVLIGSLLIYYHNSSLIKKLPGSRIFDITFTAGTFQTRFWTWGAAIKGFEEKPLLGWGPENFSTVFDKFFDIRHFSPITGGETWFDRAHSVVFDYLSEIGIIGLLAYLSIFAAFIWQFTKNKVRFLKDDLRYNLAKGAIMAMIIAYFVQNLSLFEVFPIITSFFFFLAFLIYQFGPKAEIIKEQ